MAYLTEQAAYPERVRGFFDRWLPVGSVGGEVAALSLDAAAG
jgi:hypothetical protein